jgi:hypothetical protein
MQVQTEKIMLPATVEGWVNKFQDDFGFMPMVPISHVRQFEPGSPEKVRELRQRLRKGQPLFSRHDLTNLAAADRAKLTQYISDPSWTVWAGDERKGVEQSECKKWRYRVWETWDEKKPIAMFVGLYNPCSLSEAFDPKMKLLAVTAGCGGYQRVNLFAALCKNNEELWKHPDPIGDWNDRVIRIATMTSHFAICCWGKAGSYLSRSKTVVRGIHGAMKINQLFCYGLTERYKTDPNKPYWTYQPIGLQSVRGDAKPAPLPMRCVEEQRDE